MLNTYATLVSLVAFAQDRLKRDEKGATAVEYGLMLALIAVTALVAITAVGENMAAMFEFVADVIDG